MARDLEGKQIQRMVDDMQTFTAEAARMLNRLGLPAHKLYVPRSDIHLIQTAAHQLQQAKDIAMQLVGMSMLNAEATPKS